MAAEGVSRPASQSPDPDPGSPCCPGSGVDWAGPGVLGTGREVVAAWRAALH